VADFQNRAHQAVPRALFTIAQTSLPSGYSRITQCYINGLATEAFLNDVSQGVQQFGPFSQGLGKLAPSHSSLGRSGDFLPPSTPAQEATARQDQARQSGTSVLLPLLGALLPSRRWSGALNILAGSVLAQSKSVLDQGSLASTL
jgi:hypothetical protein